MTTQKSTAAAPAASPAPATNQRKAWVKKTPIEIVLEQFKKQEDKVAGIRAELAKEEKELAKLGKAKAVLEAQ